MPSPWGTRLRAGGVSRCATAAAPSGSIRTAAGRTRSRQHGGTVCRHRTAGHARASPPAAAPGPATRMETPTFACKKLVPTTGVSPSTRCPSVFRRTVMAVLRTAGSNVVRICRPVGEAGIAARLSSLGARELQGTALPSASDRPRRRIAPSSKERTRLPASGHTPMTKPPPPRTTPASPAAAPVPERAQAMIDGAVTPDPRARTPPAGRSSLGTSPDPAARPADCRAACWPVPSTKNAVSRRSRAGNPHRAPCRHPRATGSDGCARCRRGCRRCAGRLAHPGRGE